VAAAALVSAGHVLGLSGIPMKIFGFTLATAVDIVLFFTAFRLATAKIVAARDLLLGAILSSIAWQILDSVAGVVVARDLKHAQAIAGFFGVILGLLAWFGLQAAVTVYVMEVDVVRARHLWPRSITQPPLTIADKRFLEETTQAETRRPEQKVTIEFTPEADRDPRHPSDA
jgi:membrane protein